MRKNFLEIGEIVGTHGVRGEIRVNPWCDSPDFLTRFKTLYFDKNGGGAVKVLSARPHGNIALLRLENVGTMEAAQALRGKILYMKRDDAKLEKGQYFIEELFDCTVIDDDDESIVYGIMSDVSETGANDVWHIKKDGREYLIPFIDEVVKSVDIDTGIIRIKPIKGLFDDED